MTFKNLSLCINVCISTLSTLLVDTCAIIFIFQYALIHQSEARTTRGIKTYMLRALFYILLPLFFLHSAYCEMSFCHAFGLVGYVTQTRYIFSYSTPACVITYNIIHVHCELKSYIIRLRLYLSIHSVHTLHLIAYTHYTHDRKYS